MGQRLRKGVFPAYGDPMVQEEIEERGAGLGWCLISAYSGGLMEEENELSAVRSGQAGRNLLADRRMAYLTSEEGDQGHCFIVARKEPPFLIPPRRF